MHHDGLNITACRGEDGRMVVYLLGPEGKDLLADGAPNIRVWVNDALIFDAGKVGDDLSRP